jgi:hypothetical protein
MFDRVFLSGIFRMVSAAGFTGLITYIMVTWLPLQAEDESFYVTFPKFALIAGVSLISYVLISYLFKLTEAQPVIRRVQKILFNGVPVRVKNKE